MKPEIQLKFEEMKNKENLKDLKQVFINIELLL